MTQTKRASALLAVAVFALAVTVGADARVPAPWRNCKAVNVRYPHGVGKPGAHDRTPSEPVVEFTRSAKLYRLAMTYNKGLDRDKDGIACEQP